MGETIVGIRMSTSKGPAELGQVKDLKEPQALGYRCCAASGRFMSKGTTLGLHFRVVAPGLTHHRIHLGQRKLFKV